MTDPDIEAACEDITKGLKTHRGCSPDIVDAIVADVIECWDNLKRDEGAFPAGDRRAAMSEHRLWHAIQGAKAWLKCRAAADPAIAASGESGPAKYWREMYYDLLKRVDAGEFSGVAQAARVPKVRTSHHRNKEEAGRLQELVARRYVIEECAAVCDKHAEWGESKIRDDEPAESTGNQIFATISNTANDCAAMIRDLKGPLVSSTPRETPELADRWPLGCHSPNSCSRNGRCMYFGCRHDGKDIKALATAFSPADRGSAA